MFQLSKAELKDWMSQIVISNPSAKKAIRKRPYAFTEHGVAMLSSDSFTHFFQPIVALHLKAKVFT